VLGLIPFLWWVISAPWGQGGEFGGAALILGTAVRLAFLALCSLAGATLAIIAARRAPRSPLSWVALTVNAVALGIVVFVVILNFVRAGAV
jgi:hypothetical protein